MLNQQEWQKALQHMMRHYKKADGTYAETNKEFLEVPAMKEQMEKATKLFSESGLAVTDGSVQTAALEALIKDAQKVESLDCWLLHPNAAVLEKEGDDWVKSPGLHIMDPNGRAHNILGANIDPSIEPGTPITIKGDITEVLTFAKKGSDGEDDGVAYDPPGRFYNIKEEGLEVAVNGHDKPFPMSGPSIDHKVRKMMTPSKKNTIYGRDGPSQYDDGGIDDELPVFVQCMVKRAFLNEWDNGTFVTTYCETPGEYEVEVVHPIEGLAEQFPGIGSADEDSIQEFFESKPRFLAIGNMEIVRDYKLSKMEGEELTTHRDLMNRLVAKDMLKNKRNGKGLYLDLSKNTPMQKEDGTQVPTPYVQVGDRKYVNVSAYESPNTDNGQDAKFTVIRTDRDGKVQPRIKCYEEHGTWPDGDEYHNFAGFRCVWLTGGGIRAPSKQQTEVVTGLFG